VKLSWGLSPHFNLFQYFFHLKSHPNDFRVDVVGGASLQFRQGKKTQYIPYELSDKVIDWKSMWFYIRNLSSSLPLRTAGPPCEEAVLEFQGKWGGSGYFSPWGDREAEGGSSDLRSFRDCALIDAEDPAVAAADPFGLSVYRSYGSFPL